MLVVAAQLPRWSWFGISGEFAPGVHGGAISILLADSAAASTNSAVVFQASAVGLGNR